VCLPSDLRFASSNLAEGDGFLMAIKICYMPSFGGEEKSSAGDRSAVTNYRPVSLTSVVCKQMEHAIAGYLRQVWEKS
jgi:hypothetical protein